jgi:hypothetical protein
MREMFPDVDDENHRYEHPMTAVGIVLLSAAFLESIDTRRLATFTGFSRAFISAIALNMANNRLWTAARYDCSDWLVFCEVIDKDQLWDHIEIACGDMWMPEVDTEISANPCKLYWDERGGL